MEVGLFEQVKFEIEEIGAGQHLLKFHCLKADFKNAIVHVEFKCKDMEQVKELTSYWWDLVSLLTKIISKVESSNSQ